MIGSSRVLRTHHNLKEMMALVTEHLGPALAPGIYSLGEAQQIEINGRTLSAQAAAVMTLTQQRIGTVIVLRDISEEIKIEAARKRVIQQLDENVQEPLAQLVHVTKHKVAPLREFSSEIQKHSSTLQRMILELHDLTDASLHKQPDQQRPILLDSLIWAVANEWRQVAQAQNLTFHVIIERSGLYILGQERRLRWAIGNIVDNAIKYTPPGGDLTLEIQDDISNEQAHLRVRDNGVGIVREELPHVTNRFYRGKPVTKAGRAINVPGSGQGLTTAKQIFEAHGGSIEVRSKQWVGTAVFFTLPLTAEHGYELPQVAAQLEGKTLPLHLDDIHPEP
jgi:signal transduction histidine kinase